MEKLINKIVILLFVIVSCRALSYAGIVTQGGVTMSSFTLTTAPTNGYVLTSDASGNGTWKVVGTGLLNSTNTWTAPNTWKSSATFQNGLFSVGGSTLVITGGQVAIGTTTPSNALSVESGNIDASGYIQAGGPNGGAVLCSGTPATIGGSSAGGVAFWGRPRIGDWGNYLEMGNPTGDVNGNIIQISDKGVFTGTSSGLGLAPTLRNTLDNGSGNALISGTLTIKSSATFQNGSFSVGGSTFVISNGGVAMPTLTVTSSAIIKGVSDGSAASAGNIGELVEAKQSTPVNAAASGSFGQITSVTLTAGDWDVYGVVISSAAGATCTAARNIQVCLGGTTASTSGCTVGYDWLYGYPPVTGAASQACVPFAVKRSASVASSTTYYLNGMITYTAGTPTWYGSISARRRR